MRSYYRRRLITVAMLSFTILLMLIIIALFVFSYIQSDRETDRTVEMLLSREEQPAPPVGGNQFPGKWEPMQDQRVFPSAYYDIRADQDGTVVSSELFGFTEDSDSDVQNYVSQILQAGNNKGRLGSFKYGVEETADGRLHIVLMSITIQMQMLFSMLRTALIIGAVLLALLFVILLPVTSRAAALLAQNTEKQKQFITDAGHELKTPVAVIRSNLDVMELLQGKSNWSGNIRCQVDRLEGLVKQLLLTARVDEKQWTGKTTVLDFSKELENELGIYEETVLQKDLKLQKEVETGLHIKGDEESVKQLIHALLDNAMQYTPSGGSVWVNAGREKKTLSLEIRNTVDALPHIEPERLLDRFTRGDNARSRKNGGTGIGLSTAKSIVELYKGNITVSYAGDNMFQVLVRLPLTTVS